MADDVRGAPTGPFAFGVAMHRKVDAFVDSHPAVARSIALLPSEYRRYGGVMTDVLYDHFLSVAWEGFASVERDRFTSGVYRVLGDAELPSPFRERAERIVRYRWLDSYGDFETVDRVLRFLATRLRRPGPLAEGAAVLWELREPFAGLWPDVVAFARTLEEGAAWAARPLRPHGGPGSSPSWR